MRMLAIFTRSIRWSIFLILIGALVLPFIPQAKSASPTHICYLPTGSTQQYFLGNSLKADGVYDSVWAWGSAQRIITGGYFSTDYDIEPQENIAIDNSTITDMWISVKMKIPTNEGFTWNTTGRNFRLEYAITPATNTSAIPSPWEYNQSYPYTTNESTLNVNDISGFHNHQWFTYQWHIFNATHWTSYKLQRYFLYVALYSPDYNTDEGNAIYVDYLGIEYNWVESVFWNQGEFSGIISGLIWLLIVFFPPIALRSGFGSMGFAGGIIIMTVLIGIADSGFLPVTVISLISVGILFMKGE